jgi:hypothetical protein
MKRRRAVFLVAELLGLGVGVCFPVSAQEMAPPVSVEPQHLEASAPPAPAQMRAEDAALLLQQLRGAAEAPAPQVAPQAPPAPAIVPQVPPAAHGSGGVSRTISVEPPEVVNHSAQFLFHDVTDRAATVPKLPLAERRAAVEAYRQSRVTQRGTVR